MFKVEVSSLNFDYRWFQLHFLRFPSRSHMLSYSGVDVQEETLSLYQASGFTLFTPLLIALLMRVVSLWKPTSTRVP